MKSGLSRHSPCDLIIFGATGDLSRRKLIPALYKLFINGFLPQGSRIIGVGRHDQSQQHFVDLVATCVQDLDHTDASQLHAFSKILVYAQLDVESQDNWNAFAKLLDKNHVRLFYMALGSNLFTALSTSLAKNGLVSQNTRLVVEKPIGHNQQSARELNRHIHSVFAENQVFRIDHYLGKETVQNLMALRFANSLFEPLWNSRFIDHVQITVAETIGVKGRGGYYDKTGAMRDMVQNHLLKLLCLTTMEPPYAFAADPVRDEKLKVLNSLEQVQVDNAANLSVRGQYTGNQTDSTSYLDDVDAAESTTESYVALRTHINNWRWAGTPFYLRTGKALASRISEIAVAFKRMPHSIFGPSAGQITNNQLVIRVQPNESIVQHIMVKNPQRKGMKLRSVPLDMTFAKTLGAHQLTDAYERLLLDVIRNDQTLFMRHDEVEAAWRWTDSVIAAWEETQQALHYYPRGSQGPNDAFRLISQGGEHCWRDL